MPLTLKPELHMRLDGNRVVVYPHDSFETGIAPDFEWRLLHPMAAVLIALFDGAKPTEQVAEEYRFLSGVSRDEAERFVSGFLEQHKELMTEYVRGKTYRRQYRPDEFIMDVNSVSLSSDRLNLPTSVVWVITLDCPFHCVYCFADVNRKQARDGVVLKLKDLSTIVAQFKELELGAIGISGGDPFSHPRIIDLLAMLVEIGHCPLVPTKLPLSRRRLQELKEIGIPRIQFSIDSPLDARVTSLHLGIADDAYLGKILTSLKTAGELGMDVHVNSVVTKHNIATLPDIVRFFGGLGFVSRLSLSQAGGSIYRSFDNRMVERSEYDLAKESLDALQEQFPHMILNLPWISNPSYMTFEERAEFFEHRPRCSAGRWAFAVLPNGDMTLCEELYYHPEFIIGNVLETPIRELWNSKKMFSVLRPDQNEVHAGPCADCPDWDQCNKGRGRCWQRAIKAYPDRHEPHYWPDPFCPRAPPTTARIV